MIQRLNMMLYKNDVVKLKNEDSIEDKRYLVFIKMFFFINKTLFLANHKYWLTKIMFQKMRTNIHQ